MATEFTKMHLILLKTSACDHTKWALNIHAELPSGYESLINATPIDAVLYQEEIN